ncbi:MAG TPA: hypothetical protein PLO25_00035 [Candidatus Saccharibacteria bacterium]|nr:hypothetical protein [Candidatus Saccharibacteria bacterium]
MTVVLAGNVWECTSGTVQSPIIQPGIVGAGYAWRDWNALITVGNLPVNPFPSYGAPATSNWTHLQGIGRVYSSSDETGLRGFVRGGNWYDGNHLGFAVLVSCLCESVYG